MDVRRIVLIPRSLAIWRRSHHRSIKHALAIFAFVLPNLMLSVTLVPASQATRSTQPFNLTSFVIRTTHRAIEAWPVDSVLLPAPTVTAPRTTAPAVPLPVPAPPAPPPTPPPAVDGSSAAAWAASPGVVCIRQHESGDDYSTNTGNGYYGAYQDSLSTWESHGGTGLPSDAPPAVQDQINYEIWLSGGWGQWGTAPGCGL